MSGITVKVRQSKFSSNDKKYNDDIKLNVDRALNLFKKKIKDSRLMIEINERQYFIKPSIKRKLKHSKAVARNKFLNNVKNNS